MTREQRERIKREIDKHARKHMLVRFKLDLEIYGEEAKNTEKWIWRKRHEIDLV